MRIFSKIIAISLILAATDFAKAQSMDSIPTANETSIPGGWYDFCKVHSEDCLPNQLPLETFVFSPAMKAKIRNLNRTVNKKILQKTDLEHLGVAEDWNYPYDGQGDCEDIALYKRKLLTEMGVPRESLALAIVENNSSDKKEKHTVLILMTNEGDFVLDNLNEDIKKWRNSGYTFMKMQSRMDPQVWLEIPNVKYSRQDRDGLLKKLVTETPIKKSATKTPPPPIPSYTEPETGVQ